MVLFWATCCLCKGKNSNISHLHTVMFAIKLIYFHFINLGQGTSRGLVRYQRGDQGPDDLENDITIIDTSFNETTDLVIPPIGGPNVCRSRARTFCCPGWHQRGSTGLCLVPICSSNRCGANGRCIKPNLCLCEGGKIATKCGDSKGLEDNGE